MAPEVMGSFRRVVGGKKKTLAGILGAWGECPSKLPGPVALGMCEDYYVSASEKN